MQIRRFTHDLAFDYGGLHASRVEELDNLIAMYGWRRAVSEILSAEDPDIVAHTFDNIENENRTGWKFLLRLGDDASGMDYGCGWGSVTPSLARSVRAVTGIDLDWKRLRVLQGKLEADGVSNVSLIQAGSALPLPVPSRSVDFISINGVLEWVALSLPGDAHEAQRALLKECRRILRPDGELYIAIENRFALRYFAGARDEHSGLRYTTLMPRRIANIYMRWRRGRPYRTYTHSLGALQELLRSAGFPSQRVFCAIPSYNEPSNIVAIDKVAEHWIASPARSFVRQLAKNVIAWTGLAGSTANCYAIVASTKRSNHALPERIMQSHGFDEGVRLLNIRLTNAGNALAFLGPAEESAPKFVLKMPVSTGSEDLVRHEGCFLRKFAEKVGWTGFVDWGVFERHPYIVSRFVPGTDGEALVQAGRPCDDIVRPLLNVVDSLQRVNCGVVAVTDEFVGRWTNMGRDGISYCIDAIPVQVMRDAVMTVRDAMMGRRETRTIAHGDLHFGNVIFSDGGQVVAVVDWAHATEWALPLDDRLFVSFARRLQYDKMNIEHAVMDLLEGRFSDVERSALLSCMPEHLWDDEYFAAAMVAFMLRELRKRRAPGDRTRSSTNSQLLRSLEACLACLRGCM